MQWVAGLVFLASILSLTVPSGQAETAREIEIQWESLLPAEAGDIRKELQALQVELRKRPAAEQAALPRIAAELSLRARMDTWHLSAGRLSPAEQRVLEASPSTKYPETARLWGQISDAKRRLDALDVAVNEPLDGQKVRLSGYLLPLDFEAGNVREFLLVPFVGACIHVPPPPPNQIVHVAIAGGYEPEFQYEPVTVTGVLAAKSAKYDLFLEDGEAPVDVGYRLEAESVTPLEPTRM